MAYINGKETLLVSMIGKTVTDPLLEHYFDGSSTVLELPTIEKIRANAFYMQSFVKSVNMPRVKNIENNAFMYCSSLSAIELPEVLETIGDYAFAYSKVDIKRIPASVVSIGSGAFAGCANITSITFEGTPTDLACDAFMGCTALTTINVPWGEGEVGEEEDAPWGAANATINYGYKG